MTISEYIAKMEALKAEHGDLEVETMCASGDRVAARTPGIGYKKILVGRQHKPVFWSYDPPETKGDKVVRV